MTDLQWFPIPGTIAASNEAPKECWTATPIDGYEPGFHPIFYTEAEAVELCDAMNTLGWSEDDYFAHAREVDEAMKNGALGKLVAKRMTRGFWRGVLTALRGG